MKTYVLDTNVLLHDPNSLVSFPDSIIIIPMVVLEEIDTFKKDMGELGKNSRQVSRFLDKQRLEGDLTKGVGLSNGCILKVCQTYGNSIMIEDKNKADNKIIAVALAQSEFSADVILISKDINLRIKANVLGIKSEDYLKDKVEFEEIYTGIKLKDVDAEIINSLYAEKSIPNFIEGVLPNQYFRLKSNISDSQTVICRYNKKTDSLVLVNRDKIGIWGIKPKNLEQVIALDMLLNDDMKIVTLIGKAGCGKTLLAVASALSKTLDEKIYSKILIARPVIPMGKDIGFLPGTLEEKLNPWMQPIFDNLEFILSNSEEKGSCKYKELIEQGLIAVEPLTYIRGRSIPNQLIIIDEAQNLSPHEVKTIITRVGNGTKIIFTGDCHQIDNPYIDANSNGLSYIVERFKNYDISGHITLIKGERSELAELASNIL